MFFRGGVLFTNGRADLFNKGCFQHLEQTRGFDLCVMQRRVKVVPLHHLWPRPQAPFQSGWPSLALCLPHTEGESGRRAGTGPSSPSVWLQIRVQEQECVCLFSAGLGNRKRNVFSPCRFQAGKGALRTWLPSSPFPAVSPDFGQSSAWWQITAWSHKPHCIFKCCFLIMGFVLALALTRSD